MTNKFKAGDKVRCVEGSYSKHSGNLVTGTVYTVCLGQEDTHTKECIKVEGLVSHYDVCRFELVQRSFDIHKDKWFIRTPTKEVSKFVQEWLFEKGFKWQSLTKDGKIQNYCDGYVVALSVFEKESFMWCFDAPEGYQEIKLTFKTVVDTVEYPTIVPEKSEAQKQVDILEQKIKELQDQLEVVKEEIK